MPGDCRGRHAEESSNPETHERTGRASCPAGHRVVWRRGCDTAEGQSRRPTFTYKGRRFLPPTPRRRWPNFCAAPALIMGEESMCVWAIFDDFPAESKNERFCLVVPIVDNIKWNGNGKKGCKIDGTCVETGCKIDAKCRKIGWEIGGPPPIFQACSINFPSVLHPRLHQCPNNSPWQCHTFASISSFCDPFSIHSIYAFFRNFPSIVHTFSTHPFSSSFR